MITQEDKKLMTEFLGWSYDVDNKEPEFGYFDFLFEGKCEFREKEKYIDDFVNAFKFDEWKGILRILAKINECCMTTGYVDECIELWNLRLVSATVEEACEGALKYIKWYNKNVKQGT